MTTATRKLSKVNGQGQRIETVIELSRATQDKISYADGYNVNLGREAIERLTITTIVDGKTFETNDQRPHLLNPKYDQAGIKAGAVARIGLGKVHLGQASYDEIMGALAEMEEEVTEPEYTQIKEAEAARKAAGEAWLNSDEYRRMEELERKMDDPNSDY